MAYLLCFMVVVLASVLCFSLGDVGDFAPCLQFFYRSWPPKGLNGTPICQRFNNQYRFASLYSRPRRSPWFSAYVYSVPSGKRPAATWKYEPQLAYPSANGNMAVFPPEPLDPVVIQSQAVEPDYINSSYTRGHLNPSLHHQLSEDRSSTFTLTNVVPQMNGSNDGPWVKLEQNVNKTLGAYCIGKAYVVTGIIPYKQQEHWIKNKRVAVPEYLWSAYCCPQFDRNIPQNLHGAFPTYAAIGRNDINSTEEIVPIDKSAKKQFWGYDVKQMTLETLEGHLTQRFDSVVSVFYEKCKGGE